MLKLEIVVGVMAALVACGMAKTTCGVCDPSACDQEVASTCLAGVVKDECGCCDVCGKLEGMPCKKNKECGYGLQCRDATSTGAVCQCQFDMILCGTDNKTYTNLCQLSAAAAREGNHELEVAKHGPCDDKPRIITKPEYVRNHTDSNVVLQCEAMGNPTPHMSWVFTNAAHEAFSLPSDDNKVVTSSRGGPGKYVATSWLQIEGLEKHHEGDYTCMAYNSETASDKATARIKVVAP